LAVAGTRQLTLPARAVGQARRTAAVELRFGTIEITRSPNEKHRALAKTVRLTLIGVRAIAPPAGVEAVPRPLLTSHEAGDADQAGRSVGWHQLRWCIEQRFRVLTSPGVQREDSQRAAAERLAKLTAAAIRAACRTRQLLQERDGAHGPPASHAFSAADIETIAALTPTLEGNTERQRNPHRRAAWLAPVGSWLVGRPELLL